jgi:hypothetical protein
MTEQPEMTTSPATASMPAAKRTIVLVAAISIT